MRRAASPKKSSAARSAFKPPSLTASSPQVHCTDGQFRPPPDAVTKYHHLTTEELQSQIGQLETSICDDLKRHNEQRKAEGKSEQDPHAIVQTYIQLLTEYNQVKDTAQILFDKVADIEGITSQSVHQRYEVSESD